MKDCMTQVQQTEIATKEQQSFSVSYLQPGTH